MKIVFFGDSITDCDRDRSDDSSLGNGYVKVLADKLRPIYPDMDISLINKGVSRKRIDNAINSGELPFYSIGVVARKIRQSDLEAWLASKRTTITAGRYT